MNPTKERVLNNVIRSDAAREGAKAVRGRNKGKVTQSFRDRYSSVLRKAKSKKVTKELRKNTKIIHKLRSKHPVDEMTREDLIELIVEATDFENRLYTAREDLLQQKRGRTHGKANFPQARKKLNREIEHLERKLRTADMESDNPFGEKSWHNEPPWMGRTGR